MNLRFWVFLAIAVICYSVPGQAAEVVGSGDEEPAAETTPASTVVVTVKNDDEDDIYLEGSGGTDDEDKVGKVEAGSGDEPSTTVAAIVTPKSDKNRKCTTHYCWCVFNNGTEVLGTRKYMDFMDCTAYAVDPTDPPKTTIVPIRTKATVPPQPDVNTVMTGTEDDIIIDFEPETTTTSKPRPPVVVEKDIIDNRVTVSPPKVVKIDEDKEEETNMIGYANSQKSDVDRTAVDTGLYITHPGILAAIIGGAVVGLLCAILLVMFIIYRVRKKDEGSYPLDDSKPLKNYAYAKAPSREFYA